MLAVGPVTLTLNALETINNPSASYSNPATQVQIQNASPFILNVLSGGDQYVIQSFTAQTIPTTGGESVLITPTSGPSGTQGNLTAVFLLAGQSPPIADGQLTGAAQYANGLGSLLSSFTPSAGSFTVPVTPQTRTLIIEGMSNTGNYQATTFTVAGVSSGLSYRSTATPYLVGPTSCLMVVAVSGLVDSEVSVILGGTLPTGTSTVNVYGDTAAYDETIFYNGKYQTAAQSLSAAGTVNILEGPARLISASTLATGTSASGSLHIFGGNIILEGIIANQGTGNVSIPFPENTIISYGDVIYLSQTGTGSTFASIGYAYP